MRMQLNCSIAHPYLTKLQVFLDCCKFPFVVGKPIRSALLVMANSEKVISFEGQHMMGKIDGK